MRVVVAFKHVEDRRDWLIRLKSHLQDDKICRREGVRYVDFQSDLRRAAEEVRANPKDSILLTIGYEPAPVLEEELTREERQRLAVIVHDPEFGEASRRRPSASLLKFSAMITKGDPITAIRKAVLRLSVGRDITIRELTDAEDFRRYFRLRYKVWKQMGYLAPEQDCAASRWELDYLDRTSVPIGAFRDDALVGCTRLVYQVGRPTKHVRLIQQLIEETGSDTLRKNFQPPASPQQPFDVLDAFTEFRRFYKPMARDQVKSAEVSRVIVDPDNEQRGRGLGEVLVDSAVSLARMKHFQVLFLACRDSHESFYHRSGFRRIPGVSADEFTAGIRVPCIAMIYQLAPVAALRDLKASAF
jgi:N-acetylglutamate synthase-like GNAT family acetyltransferase